MTDEEMAKLSGELIKDLGGNIDKEKMIKWIKCFLKRFNSIAGISYNIKDNAK